MDTREILVAPGRKLLYLGFEMADDPHALKLYIDGSCYRNPGGPGAYACVVKFPEAWNRDDEPVFALGFHETTNNRMELAACIRAFEHVIEHGYALRVQRVIIITDSLYAFDNFNRAPGWRSNGWRNSSGRPVENSDLWKRLLAVRQRTRLRTDLQWRKGKKSPILKAVDRLAKEAARNPQELDRGFRGGKMARSKIRGGAPSLYPARGQFPVIRVYRSSLIRKTGHKITFEVVHPETDAYELKCFAYADAVVAAQLHRQHCYRVRFNADPKNPLIEELVAEVACPAPQTANGAV